MHHAATMCPTHSIHVGHYCHAIEGVSQKDENRQILQWDFEQ